MSLLAGRPLRALPVLAVLAITAPAQADSLEVQVAADLALDADLVKSLIAAEIGVSIVDGDADLGSVDIRLDDTKQLVVTHRRPDASLLVRVVALPALPADRLAMIGFVTGNLVRDQLADLTPSASDVAAATPAPALRVAVAAPVPSTKVSTAAATQVAETAEVTVPLSIGLIPPLSTDRLFTSRARVRGALNVVAGASAGIDGASISGVVDLSGSVRGLQIGGVATLAKDTVGLQLGGAATLARDLRGAQLAGAVALARDVFALQVAGAAAGARDMRGMQIAGAATGARDVRGIQIAGAATAARDVRGIQIAGAATAARDVHGIQIAGAGVLARRVWGLELAGGAAVTGHIEGAQIAPITVAGTVHGLQLGAINIARSAHGLQLGAINISDANEGVQVGVLNFVRRGRTDIDAWAETTGLAAFALRHGGRYVHNVYAIGFTPDGGETPLVGFGLGVHRPLGEATLDLDAMAWQTHMFADGIGLLTQARATLAIELGSFAAFVAAAYNVSIEDHGETRPVRTLFARTIDEPMSDVDVALWPSLSVGVRGHLGAMR